MGFDRPTRTKDYVDLKEETANGPRLLAFRILDFLPVEEGDFVDRATGERSKVWPVLADCMVIDGEHAGALYRGKVYRYAITNALRGADTSDPQPTTRPGQQLAIKAERASGKGQSKDTVYGNPPDDEEYATITAEFLRFGGWDGPTAAQKARAARNGAAAPATAAEPAAATTAPAGQASGSGARRPFGRG